MTTRLLSVVLTNFKRWHFLSSWSLSILSCKFSPRNSFWCTMFKEKCNAQVFSKSSHARLIDILPQRLFIHNKHFHNHWLWWIWLPFRYTLVPWKIPCFQLNYLPIEWCGQLQKVLRCCCSCYLWLNLPSYSNLEGYFATVVEFPSVCLSIWLRMLCSIFLVIGLTWTWNLLSFVFCKRRNITVIFFSKIHTKHSLRHASFAPYSLCLNFDVQRNLRRAHNFWQ